MAWEFTLDTSAAHKELDVLEARIKALPKADAPKPPEPDPKVTHADVERVVDEKVTELVRQLMVVAGGS